ncbi:Tautomerase/MIF [Xylaria intraflava]|nr:Tautomerase/MIF [Xylaria intraflava]
MLDTLLRKSAEEPASGPADPHRSDSAAVNPPQPGSSAAPAGPSFAQRKAQQSQPSDTILVQGNDFMRSIDRPLPGDVIGRRKTKLDPEQSRKKSAFFEAQFAAPNRGEEDLDLVHVRKEAMVVAELKTNVIVNDEFAFISKLAQHLSHRYQRPITSINVTLHHSVCMLFGGDVEPACTLAIYALPSLVQPATNRRNAMLIQQHLNETLGVMSMRCYIRFEGTPEENFGIGGKTVASKVDELSARNGDQESAVSRKSSKSSRGIMKSVRSLGSFRSNSGANVVENASMRAPHNSGETTRITTIPELPPTPPYDEKSAQGDEEEPRKVRSRRKSLRFTLFGNE